MDWTHFARKKKATIFIFFFFRYGLALKTRDKRNPNPFSSVAPHMTARRGPKELKMSKNGAI